MNKLDYSTKRKIVFVVLTLLSLSFICLISNFFNLYKEFLIGTFGLVIYPIILLSITFCILYLSNKVIKFNKKELILGIIVISLFMCILQLALTGKFSFDSLKIYLQECYNSQTTSGGVIFGILVYPVKKLLFAQGAYVLYLIALVVVVSVMIDNYYTKLNSGKSVVGAKIHPVQTKKVHLNELNNFAENKKYSNVDTKESSKEVLIPKESDENDNKDAFEVLYGRNKSRLEAMRTLYPEKINTLSTNYLNDSLNKFKEPNENSDISQLGVVSKDKNDRKEKIEKITNNISSSEFIRQTNPGRIQGDIISGDFYFKDKEDGKQNSNDILDDETKFKHINILEEIKKSPTVIKIPKYENEIVYERKPNIADNIDKYDEQKESKPVMSIETDEDYGYEENDHLPNIESQASKGEYVEDYDVDNNEQNEDSDNIQSYDEEYDYEKQFEEENYAEQREEIIENFDDVEEEIQNNTITYGSSILRNEPESKVPFSLNKENVSVSPVINNELPKHSSINNIQLKNSFMQNQSNTIKPIVKEEECKPIVYSKPYVKPPISLLTIESDKMDGAQQETSEKALLLEQSLSCFKIDAKVSNIIVGPSITRYELTMPQGVSVKKIIGYSDDIAMALASRGAIRIEAPIPGKNAVGIEVPNERSATIGFKDLLLNPSFDAQRNPLKFALGKNITNECVYCDLAKAPHILIAGSSGSGKSVCLNTIILNIIYNCSPEDVRLILVDPKKVEFTNYEGIPHLLIPSIITEPPKVVSSLNWLIDEMERRYTMFSSLRLRNIGEYNKLPDVVSKEKPKMPYIVLIVDELADLMSVEKKNIEDKINRLAAKARAAGIHMILATQRPSVDVVTGTIKNNFPTRISFALTSYSDSKTILDRAGAEKLLGKGDMLYFPQDLSEPIRIQGTYVSNTEIDNIVSFTRKNNEALFDDSITKKMLSNEVEKKEFSSNKGADDDLFIPTLKKAIMVGQASASSIQRWFGVGWQRAAKLYDSLVETGFLGEPDKQQRRKILIDMEQFNQLYGEDNESF